jgi:sugar O-acyltransferase (sialic acid O-acetyltransferase NeuD family)
MKRLALLGASGHGKVVADTALCADWDSVCFFDAAWPGLERNGPWQVQGDERALLASLDKYDGVLISIGNCATRWNFQQKMQQMGAPLVTLIHPSAVVSRYAALGLGTVVMAGAVINAGAVVGPGCIVNTGATVDHDCVLAEAVHVCPGAHLSGDVRVGQGSWIGVGASVKQGMVIGESVTVGAGAAVVTPIADRLTVVGVPAIPKLN